MRESIESMRERKTVKAKVEVRVRNRTKTGKQNVILETHFYGGILNSYFR